MRKDEIDAEEKDSSLNFFDNVQKLNCVKMKIEECLNQYLRHKSSLPFLHTGHFFSRKPSLLHDELSRLIQNPKITHINLFEKAFGHTIQHHYACSKHSQLIKYLQKAYLINAIGEPKFEMFFYHQWIDNLGRSLTQLQSS